MNITWRRKKTNELALKKVTEILNERQESVVETIKGRKLEYYGHQTRKQSLTKTLIKERVEGSR